MNKLKDYREKAGLSQKALSELAEVNIRQIQRYEADDSSLDNMTLKNAVLIARALNIKAEDLIGGIDVSITDK